MPRRDGVVTVRLMLPEALPAAALHRALGEMLAGLGLVTGSTVYGPARDLAVTTHWASEARAAASQECSEPGCRRPVVVLLHGATWCAVHGHRRMSGE